MAGLGSRFADAGYKDPKPLIDVNGKPMILSVVENLNISDAQYIFVVQQKHFIEYDLGNFLRSHVDGCRVIVIDGVTDGAARTTLAAKCIIDSKTPLIIANSDQLVDWDSLDFLKTVKKNHVIALFKEELKDPKWSFAKIEKGLISEVAEKKPISKNASVGIYGWSKGSDYVRYAEKMIHHNIKTNNEFYICPVYNEAILDGKDVIPFFVEKMYGLGTPEDLERYLQGN